MKNLGRILAAGLVVAMPIVSVMSAVPAMAAGTSESTTTKTPAVKGYMTGAKAVQKVQIALARSGANVAIDGIWGPKTTQALKTFQKDHHLKVTGYPDHATMKVLRSIS